jgi:Na+-translocating ferredoxin:NAD+ oxidoreductase subunit G
MNDFLKIGSKLALICAVAALSLGIVNAVTETRIEYRKAQRLQETLAAVSFEGEPGDRIEVDGSKHVSAYYPLVNSAGRTIGYILVLSGEGYGGEMLILAGYTPKGRIRSARLMENDETPGLGKEAERPEYMEMFIDTGADVPVPTRKSRLSPSDADAVTGASITFQGIAGALATGSEFIRSLVEVES